MLAFGDEQRMRVEAIGGDVLPRHAPNRIAAAILALAAAINVPIIVWIWVAGIGQSSWDPFTSSGRLTGLISAYLALIQVILLARLPWLERLVGFDHLTVWHRINGKICLYLILAHVILVTIGYTLADKVILPTEISRLVTYYAMIPAIIGTLLLIAVVGTSLVIIRRKFRYETWYAVHLMAYAGIALAWFHQVPTGNDLTANLIASNYWNGLYALTFATIVVFRLLVPVARALYFDLRVMEVHRESATVTSLILSGRNIHRLHAQAGQFFLWRFMTRGRWAQSHPFSLSREPDGLTLRLTVKELGDFTSTIHAIAPGTRVMADGPFGVFTLARRRRDQTLLLAGGIGITPIRALFETAPPDTVLIYRVGSDADLIFRTELNTIAALRNLHVHYVVGDHRDPVHAQLLSPEHLCSLVPDIGSRDVFICGPPGMVDVLQKRVIAAGIQPKHIYSERFTL